MKRPTKKKVDPKTEHIWYNLKIIEWHASFRGPRWRQEDIPKDDWRGHWIEHHFELESEERLSLTLRVEPYRQTLTVSKHEVHEVDFTIYSSSKPGGGLFQTGRDRQVRGWAFLPRSGVQELLAVLVS